MSAALSKICAKFKALRSARITSFAGGCLTVDESNAYDRTRRPTVTPVESAFDWLEHTDLSLWVRGDSMLAFPLILTVHTIAMGFLAGTSSAISLRILGVGRQTPLPVMEKFYPVLWIALAFSFVSGTLLLIGYPYKAFSNPVYYLKLSFIALAVTLVVKIRSQVLRPSAPSHHAALLASLSLASWVGTITAGRLLAYTFTWLRVGVPGGF